MNEQTRKAVGYAMDFLTFLFLQKDAKDKINCIYLFGSGARGELDKDSDIDIFIDCGESDEDVVLRIAKVAQMRFKASKDFEKWKLFNFTYMISIKAGRMREWGLRSSIESEGIELYSKSVQQQNTEKLVMF